MNVETLRCYRLCATKNLRQIHFISMQIFYRTERLNANECVSWVYMAKPHNNSQYLTSNLFRMQTKFDYYRYLCARTEIIPGVVGGGGG